MTHRDAFGRRLHVGQMVNCPDGSAGRVHALGRSQNRDSIVLVTQAWEQTSLDTCPPRSWRTGRFADERPARLVAAGETFVEMRQDPATLPNPDTWAVMQDPEGNEFCVLNADSITGLM